MNWRNFKQQHPNVWDEFFRPAGYVVHMNGVLTDHKGTTMNLTCLTTDMPELFTRAFHSLECDLQFKPDQEKATPAPKQLAPKQQRVLLPQLEAIIMEIAMLGTDVATLEFNDNAQATIRVKRGLIDAKHHLGSYIKEIYQVKLDIQQNRKS